MIKSQNIRNLNPYKVFVVLNLLALFLFLIYSMFMGNRAINWLIMENQDLDFIDFSMHVAACADPNDVYSRYGWAGAGCFPPLSYVMYYFFYRIMAVEGIVPQTYDDIASYPYFDLIVAYYTLAVVLLFLYAVSLWGKDVRSRTALFLVLVLSVPMYAGGISAGNSTVLIMSIILIALKFRESESVFCKEIALILIAICAGMKIYPAVLGLLYLLEKRYKEAVRLTVYGIVLFFTPFVFFGGISGMKQWIKNILATMDYLDFGRIQCIKGALHTFNSYIGFDVPDIVYTIIPLVFVVLMILLACLSRSKYRKLFFLVSAMIFYPTNCYRYTLCYLCVPLVSYLLDTDEQEKATTIDYVKILLYTAIFAVPLPLGILTGFAYGTEYYTLTYVEIWLYAFAYILLAVTTIQEILLQIRSRKSV